MPPLRYLLVLDFEATCDDTNRIVLRSEMEIIEFPTILYDLQQDKVLAVFHEYVRPTLHPTLTRFCTDLTGIEQSRVDAAEPFPHVWERFKAFLRPHKITDDPSSASFLTCGDWDLKTMLPQQLSLAGITDAFNSSNGSLVPPFDRWINVKKSYQRFYGLRYAKGMEGMLRHAGMELEGRHHSGIDDCKNILRLVRRMRLAGWKPENDLPS
ncbi:exonuclease RNase T and DNA polymerase III [Trametes coccinea BRFM310]|uniref:Exonuclease RNase T and DNA polymerase III n=1 Tax=Trametes coccinea (strain BRFM310) TaxID=1353009 RepID=A0A1Y2ISE2_TRAC3|nr:exonuclease RNase T and DNA polymerase III [Trametes coccinea BRFM310]